MPLISYALCVICCALITTIELANRNRRHPFGDRCGKAFWWWALVVVIDAALACLILAGAVSAELIDARLLSGTNQSLHPVVIGVFGPLALRSPVRTTTVKDQESRVGITYIYDVARLYSVYALDERFVRLRREDVYKIRETWKRRGLDGHLVQAAIHRHLLGHDHLGSAIRDEIISKTSNAMTLPTDDERLSGLIKTIKSARFGALIDELNNFSGPTDELATEIGRFEDDLEVVEEDVGDELGERHGVDSADR